MSKPSSLLLRDWLFGGPGKRRLLMALLGGNSDQGWRQAQLARAADLHPKGSVDVHLAALRQLGLITRSGNEYRLVDESPLARPLRAVLRALEALPETPVDKPPA